MKKLLLTCAAIAMTIFVTEAQTKKSTGKKNNQTTLSNEKKLNAEIAQIQLEKKLMKDEQTLAFMVADSARKADEFIAEEQKAKERISWKEQKLKEVDSLNQLKWKQLSIESEQGFVANRKQDEINKAAKLNEYQSMQVSAINQEYDEKNTRINQNTELTDEQKSQQIASMNAEKRNKLQDVLGKNKEKKLGKAQIAESKKNTEVVKAT